MKKEDFCRSAGIEGGCGHSASEILASAGYFIVCVALLVAMVLMALFLKYLAGGC